MIGFSSKFMGKVDAPGLSVLRTTELQEIRKRKQSHTSELTETTAGFCLSLFLSLLFFLILEGGNICSINDLLKNVSSFYINIVMGECQACAPVNPPHRRPWLEGTECEDSLYYIWRP